MVLSPERRGEVIAELTGSFFSLFAVCQMMREGVLAFLVAPDAAPALREMLISYSSHFHIPLATSLSPRSFTRSEYAISTQVSVADATASLLRRYRWSQVAYVYDDSASPDILGEQHLPSDFCSPLFLLFISAC